MLRLVDKYGAIEGQFTKKPLQSFERECHPHVGGLTNLSTSEIQSIIEFNKIIQNVNIERLKRD